MLVNWKDKTNPDILIEKLNISRLKNPAGDFHFEGFDYLYYFDIVFGLINFPEIIPEYDAREMLHNVFGSLVRNEYIKKNDVISGLDKKCIQYLQKPSKRFVLFTSLSVDNSLQINPLRIKNIIIKFSSENKNFESEAEEIVKRAVSSQKLTLPENYLQTRIFVTAKSIYEAADKSLDNLDLIRAIWNFYFNLQTQWQISSIGNSKPVNKILTGPIHTIHDPRGKLISENVWWYDSSYRSTINPLKMKKDLHDLEKFTQIIRNKINKSNYSNKLETALRRYVRSLDEWDWNNSFVKLWSVLELLTNTQYEKYDVTIRRAAFIYEEREYIKQVLENLREYRNSFVHHNASDSRVESYLFKLKNIVETIISFHLSNQFKFSSIQEASEFLSLPFDKETLVYQKLLRGKALKLFGG